MVLLQLESLLLGLSHEMKHFSYGGGISGGKREEMADE